MEEEEPSNLELSEQTVGAILEALAARGFTKGVFSFNDIHAEPECEMFFDISFKWLSDEEIIRAEKVQTYGSGETLDAMNPVLTAKGLHLLGKRLEKKDGRIVIKDFKTGEQDGSRAYQHAGALLGSLFGSAVKSVG